MTRETLAKPSTSSAAVEQRLSGKLGRAPTDDEIFREIVEEDLRRKSTPEQAAMLRSPEVVDRWFSTLLQMTKSVEGQLSARALDWTRTKLQLESNSSAFEREQQNYLTWKAGIIRFKTGLDEYLVEARHLRDKLLGRNLENALLDELSVTRARVRTLEEAISQHRDTICSDPDADDAHEEADEALWDLIR